MFEGFNISRRNNGPNSSQNINVTKFNKLLGNYTFISCDKIMK